MIPSLALIVDDEIEVLESFELILTSGGVRQVACLQDSRMVMQFLAETDVDVILLDLTMSYIKGQDLLTAIGEQYPEIPVVIVTATGDLQTAVECMKAGAFDYLLKPVEKMRLISCVRRAIEKRELTQENKALKQRILTNTLEHPQAFSDIVTNHPAMHSIFRYIEAIAPSEQPVLITGETGVGKELIAMVIHFLSNCKGSFVAVNVAGLDDTSFTDALFGHKKGAFTGADSSRDGLVQKATNGTLFLDEIGDLSIPSQVKLLRFLQEREYFPLGSDLPQRAVCRILAATNLNIEAIEDSSRFRKDLYYRLCTHQIYVPSLRERVTDLPLLVDHFLEKAAVAFGKKKPIPPKELSALLAMYPFPGNIRELRSMIFDAVATSNSKMLSINSLKIATSNGMVAGKQKITDPKDFKTLFADMSTLPTIKQATTHFVNEAMKRAGGNQTLAAQILGISQPALSKRLKRVSN